MGFMVRVILGLFLVLTTRQWIECAPSPSQRYIRQLVEEDAAPEIPIIGDESASLNESIKEDFSTNDVLNHTAISNDSAHSNVKLLLDEKPKIEVEEPSSNVNHSEVNKKTQLDAANEKDFASLLVNVTQTTTESSDTENLRENNGRSVDITKYISPEFHDKNNVYSLSVSSDTEKYTNLHNDVVFSSTKAYDFDKRQRDIETDVQHKLKYIDREFEEAEKQLSSSTYDQDDQDVTITKIINKPTDNETITDINYVKYKNITSHSNKVKNKVNKETDVETGESLDYTASFNKTDAYDNETPKDYKNKISSYDVFDTQFDQKPSTEIIGTNKVDKNNDKVKETVNQKNGIYLTKPPSFNKTVDQSHLLSNKIENEVLTFDNISKPKSNLSYYTSPQSAVTPTYEMVHNSTDSHGNTTSRKETVISIAKRGSTKYVDTIKPTTPTATTRVQLVTGNKENGNRRNVTVEEVVQENQIYPIQVPAPTTVTETEILDSLQTESDFPQLNVSFLPSELTTAETTDSMYTTTSMDESTTTTLETTQTERYENMHTTELEIVYESNYTEPTTTESELTSTYRTTDYTYMTYTEMAPTTTTKSAELDRINSGRGFNFTSTGLEYQTLDDKLDNKTHASKTSTDTTPKITTTTSEPIPTTTDYRDNVIFKHLETTSAHSSDILPKVNFSDSGTDENETYKEITKKSTDSRQMQTTTEWYYVRSPAVERTSETTPFIVPLNISMYEVEFAETTTISLPSEEPEKSSGGKIAAIVISSIGAVCLILLAGLLFVMRKRHKRFNYGQRCTPVSLDAYSVDNVSVYNSMRRKSAMRASKRSYGNLAFDDPSSLTNPLNFPALAKFANNAEAIANEFDEIPQVTAQTNELPEGCETKNRYANVIPLPETRVFLTPIEGYVNSDYINANYVTGPKTTKNYYIACQAPMQNTVEDFWRMVWEQQSKVILMLTHMYENGAEKCVDYLPPSEVLDCHRLFGDFQITLKNREVKEKYVISILQCKNMVSNSWREVTHLWYLGWPEKGIPSEANSLIAFLIEARSYIKSLPSTENGKTKNGEPLSNGSPNVEHNPIVVHCSPGTGRTGTVIACDIAIREFELMRQVDIPKTVYRIRRDRASSVQTKEQYQFIYNVITLYATKLTGGVLDSL